MVGNALPVGLSQFHICISIGLYMEVRENVSIRFAILFKAEKPT